MSENKIKINPKTSTVKFEDLILPKNVQDTIQNIMEDGEFGHALEANGLQPRKKILLYGPPGCGKTSIVYAFANKLGKQIVDYDSSDLISYYHGGSPRNVADAMDYAHDCDVITLFDEFESLGGIRGGGGSFSNSGVDKENDRVVTTFLNKMEKNPPRNLFFACTNHINAIDPAIVRRFDVVLEIPPPSKESLLKIANDIIQGRFGLYAHKLVKRCKTVTQVRRICLDELRKAVIAREKLHPTPTPVPLPKNAYPPSNDGSSLRYVPQYPQIRF